MNICGRPPYQKGKTPAKKPRKWMSRVSQKRREYFSSNEGKAGIDHMRLVKTLHCVGCGSPPPNDAHHCRSLPPAGEPQSYQRLPAAGRKSGPLDTIPLCPNGCHNFGPNSYHVNKRAWEERHGPDYSYIPTTRAAVAAMRAEIDF